MIKINLLPFRTARKKENIRRQVSIFMGLVMVAFLAMYYISDLQHRRIAMIERNIRAAKAEIATYQEAIRKAEEHENTLARIKKKMLVIKKLEAGRAGPVKIMDAMTRCIVAKRMWLKSMANEKESLSIKGVAVDNATIARFMKNLENSEYFTEIELESSKQVSVTGGDNKFKFKAFVINCKTVNPDMPNT